MDTRPLAALCGYDRQVVGERAIASLTCVHPLRAGLPDSFGLFMADGELYLEGELDAFQISLLRATLASAPVTGRDVVINAGFLDFVDGAATAELARFGRRLEGDGRRLLVRDARPALLRVWDLLGFEPFTGVGK